MPVPSALGQPGQPPTSLSHSYVSVAGKVSTSLPAVPVSERLHPPACGSQVREPGCGQAAAAPARGGRLRGEGTVCAGRRAGCLPRPLSQGLQGGCPCCVHVLLVTEHLGPHYHLGPHSHVCLSVQCELSRELLTLTPSLPLTMLTNERGPGPSRCPGLLAASGPRRALTNQKPARPLQNGLTPLHVAAHYDNQEVALLLLEKGASPHATAKVRAQEGCHRGQGFPGAWSGCECLVRNNPPVPWWLEWVIRTVTSTSVGGCNKTAAQTHPVLGGEPPSDGGGVTCPGQRPRAILTSEHKSRLVTSTEKSPELGSHQEAEGVGLLAWDRGTVGGYGAPPGIEGQLCAEEPGQPLLHCSLGQNQWAKWQAPRPGAV